MPEVDYSYPTTLDEEGFVSLATGPFTDSNVEIGLEFDFKEEQILVSRLSVADIFSRVGGYAASIIPIFNIMAPIFIL